MLSASYGTEDREIFSVVGGQAAAAGGNDTRTEAGRALRRGEAGDAAWYDIHLPPQPQCCLHKPLDDGTVADSLGTKITCMTGIRRIPRTACTASVTRKQRLEMHREITI